MPQDTELVAQCPTCYSTRFRLSRVRLKDFFQLALFRYPARCSRCGERVYVDRAYANFLRKEGRVSSRSEDKASHPAA